MNFSIAFVPNKVVLKEHYLPIGEPYGGLSKAMFTMKVLTAHTLASALGFQHHFVGSFISCCTHDVSSKVCADGNTFVFCLQQKGCSGRKKCAVHFAWDVKYDVIHSFEWVSFQNLNLGSN